MKKLNKAIAAFTMIVLLFTMVYTVVAEHQKEPVNNDGDTKILLERKSISKEIFERTYKKQAGIPKNRLGVASISKSIKRADEIKTSNNKALQTLYSENFDAPSVNDITMSYYVVDASYGGPEPVWYFSPASYMTHPVAYPHSGTRVARFNSYETWSGNCAALETDFLIYSYYSSDINITFYMYNDTEYTSNYDCIIPYLVSPNEDPIYADPIFRHDLYYGKGWYEVDLTLTGGINPGEGFYLGFLGVGDYGNDMYIDTVLVTQDSYVPVESISLNKFSITIKKGSTETLTATVYPLYATNKSVTWQSSNTNIASVSSAGVVTAINVGTATITARSQDNFNIYDTCTVIVEPQVTVIPGDINGDGFVTSLDATEALLHSYGLKTLYGDAFTAGDVNKDGYVNSLDATQILMKYAGIQVGW